MVDRHHPTQLDSTRRKLTVTFLGVTLDKSCRQMSNMSRQRRLKRSNGE
jgi:hypothetical protein